MKPASSAAFAVVRFVVVGGFEAEPLEFRSEPAAHREAEVAARRYGYARLYRVVGEPVTDIWREPRLVAEFHGSDGGGEARAA